MTPTTKKEFTVRVEELMSELVGVQEMDEGLQTRWHETLMEGYSRALALEAQRRRLRKRLLELADLSEPDAGALRELTSLTRQEARLGRRERKLRALLDRLRNREHHWPVPRITR
jgi:hypothetical protein